MLQWNLAPVCFLEGIRKWINFISTILSLKIIIPYFSLKVFRKISFSPRERRAYRVPFMLMRQVFMVWLRTRVGASDCLSSHLGSAISQLNNPGHVAWPLCGQFPPVKAELVMWVKHIKLLEQCMAQSRCLVDAPSYHLWSHVRRGLRRPTPVRAEPGVSLGLLSFINSGLYSPESEAMLLF